LSNFFDEEKFSAQPSKNKVGDENLPLRILCGFGLDEKVYKMHLSKNKSANSVKNIFNSRLQS
jgi:hypothetical protein